MPFARHTTAQGEQSREDGFGWRFWLTVPLVLACMCLSMGSLRSDFHGFVEGRKAVAEQARQDLHAFHAGLAASSAYPDFEPLSAKACGARREGVGDCLRAEADMRREGIEAWRQADIGTRTACLERAWDGDEPAARLYACLKS